MNGALLVAEMLAALIIAAMVGGGIGWLWRKYKGKESMKEKKR